MVLESKKKEFFFRFGPSQKTSTLTKNISNYVSNFRFSSTYQWILETKPHSWTQNRIKNQTIESWGFLRRPKNLMKSPSLFWQFLVTSKLRWRFLQILRLLRISELYLITYISYTPIAPIKIAYLSVNSSWSEEFNLKVKIA